MPSTYTTSLSLEKQATGENSATWGAKANVVFDLIEQAIAGVINVTHDDAASYTLTATQGVSNEARNMVINITGTLTDNRNLVVPSVDKLYVFKNSTTGGFAVTVKTSGGTGVYVPNGETEILYCDGTNVYRAQTTPTGTGAPVRAVGPSITIPRFPDAGGSSYSTIAGYQAASGSFAAFSGCTAYGYKAFNGLSGTGMTFQGTAIGQQALQNCLSAGNTAVGSAAGFAVTSGADNTFIGQSAGSTLTTGSNNTLVGRSAAPSAIGVDNEITLGNSSISTLRCQVTSITSLSDARDKTDITPLPSGLDTVMALNPVRFTWNMRDGGKVGVTDSGFIAQDLQAVDDCWLNLVYAENPDKLEASYGRLIPVLVKAIQELKAEIEQLKGA